MNEEHLEFLRYPVGRDNLPKKISQQQINEWIDALERFPGELSDLVKSMNEEQLNTPYRPDGWTVRQVVHHVADSHANSYIRFRWALTEDAPVIKVYDQDRWANLPDARTAPVAVSLEMISAIHKRWVLLLRSLSQKEWARKLTNPEKQQTMRLDELLGHYAWHSRHHYAHIERLVRRNAWSEMVV